MKAELLKPFFSQLLARLSLSPEDMRIVSEAADEVREVSSGTNLLLEGDCPRLSTLIVDGIAARYTIVEDGGRQITAFAIAGDFADLQSFVLRRMDHGIVAMTDLTVVTFPHERLDQITREHHQIGRLLWFSTLVEASIYRQWLTSMGQLSGASHLAHLFCEHYLRAKAAGLVTDMTYAFLITQTDLADALGLSAVHTNRVLGELRRSQLITWNGSTVRIMEWDRLKRFAMFDPAYLYLANAE